MTLTQASQAPHLCSYEDALTHVAETFGRLTADTPLFATDASGLWDLYMRYLDRHQHYNCRACRNFIERYGGLAAVIDGRIRSPLWASDGPYVDNMHEAFQAMRRVVERSKITGVFVSKANVIGTPDTITSEGHVWNHFHARISTRHINRSPVLSADQVMAEKREEYAMLSRSFGEFSLATVRTAHELLTSGRLYRSEKHEGVAKWMLDLYVTRECRSPIGLAPNTVTWLAVADAPAGWCHVRSGMIGTLLEDIEAGLSFDQIKARHDAKMSPTLYMRPQAQPSAGNIAQAEKIVAQLESAGSLARRFARLDEIDPLWLPTTPTEAKHNATSPVFGHLLTKPIAPGLDMPAVTMTWVKFRDTVLTTAVSVDFKIPVGRASYCAIVTAVNPDAPPILQWDREDRRNPASWYLRVNGSMAAEWNLNTTWAKVNAFTLRPCQWYGNEAAKEGNAVIAILDGARSLVHAAGHGGGFFPESLRSEYHAVRRTMEAYAKAADIADRETASACGIMLQAGSAWSGMTFRVTTASGTTAIYNLDRWD